MASKSRRRSILKSRNSIGSADSEEIIPDVELCAVNNNTTTLIRNAKRVSFSAKPEVKEIPNLCVRRQDEGIDMEMTFCTGGDDVFPECEMSPFMTYNENLPNGTMDMSMSKTIHEIESRHTSISSTTDFVFRRSEFPPLGTFNDNFPNGAMKSEEAVPDAQLCALNNNTTALLRKGKRVSLSSQPEVKGISNLCAKRQEEGIDMEMTFCTGDDVFPEYEMSAFRTYNENLPIGTMDMSMSKTFHEIESRQNLNSTNDHVHNPVFRIPNPIIKPHNEPSTRSTEDVTENENLLPTVPIGTSQGFTRNTNDGNLTMTFDDSVGTQNEGTDMDITYGIGNDVFQQCEISAFKTFNENLLNGTMDMSMSKAIHEIESKQTSVSTNNAVHSPVFKIPNPIIKPHNELPKRSTENVPKNENALPPVPISTREELTGNASKGNLTMTFDHSLRIQDEEMDMEMTFSTEDDVFTDCVSAFKTFNENLPIGATDMSMSKTMHPMEPKPTSISTNNPMLSPAFGTPNPIPIFKPHNELPTRSTEHVADNENMLPTVPIMTNKGFIGNSKKGTFSMAFDRVVYSGPAHFRKNNVDVLRKQLPGSYGRFASVATPKRKNTVFKHGTSVEVQTTPSLANECKSASTSTIASTSTKSSSTSTIASTSTKCASTSMAASMLKMNTSPLLDEVESPKVSVTALKDSIQAESLEMTEVVVVDETEKVHAIPKSAPSSEEVTQNAGENLPVVPNSAPGSQEAKQVVGETLPVVPKSAPGSQEPKQVDGETLPVVPKSVPDYEVAKQDEGENLPAVPKSISNSEGTKKANRDTLVKVNLSNESVGIFDVSRVTCISTDSEDDFIEDEASSNRRTTKIASYKQNGPFVNLLQLYQNAVGVGRVVLLYKLKNSVCSLPDQQFEDFNEDFGEHNFPEDLLKSCKMSRDLKTELLKPLYVGLEYNRNANT